MKLSFHAWRNSARAWGAVRHTCSASSKVTVASYNFGKHRNKTQRQRKIFNTADFCKLGRSALQYSRRSP